MKNVDLKRLRPGDEIEVGGTHWRRVLQVPFGFPWIAHRVEIDTGWPIHKDHITAIRKKR